MDVLVPVRDEQQSRGDRRAVSTQGQLTTSGTNSVVDAR